MQTFPIFDTNGDLYAFEINHFLISGATIGRIVRSQLEATITPNPTKAFSNKDVRLGFSFKGVQFIVVEPFGDNSRYWIGPYSESDGLVRNPLIDLVHACISEYRPTPLGWLRTFRGRPNSA